MSEMTPEEKKLWQCYHARAMQAIVSNSKMCEQISELTADFVFQRAEMIADRMLSEAKRKGAV